MIQTKQFQFSTGMSDGKKVCRHPPAEILVVTICYHYWTSRLEFTMPLIGVRQCQ